MGNTWSSEEQQPTANSASGVAAVEETHLEQPTEHTTTNAAEEEPEENTDAVGEPQIDLPSLDSFILLDFPEQDELVTPISDQASTQQTETALARMGHTATWLPRQMQSGIEKVVGGCVEGLVSLAPEQGKELLGSYILFALNLALEGTAALHDTDETHQPEEQQSSSLSFLLRRVVEPKTAHAEAAERLARHKGNAGEAANEAFSYYLGMRAKVEIMALKRLPGPVGLLYAFYLHLRFTAIVALLNGYDTSDHHTLFLVAFTAIGFETDSELTTEEEVEQIAKKQLTDMLDPMSYRQYLVEQILEEATTRILTTLIGKELFPGFEVLLLTKEIVGALWMSHAPLARAQKTFPPKTDSPAAASSSSAASSEQ